MEKTHDVSQTMGHLGQQSTMLELLGTKGRMCRDKLTASLAKMIMGCLCTICLSSIPLAYAQATIDNDQTVRTIEIDLQKATGPHSEVPLMTVGAGRANEGLRSDWQEQLGIVQREIGFRYLRFHGLLSDDMGVYTEDHKGKPLHNFQYVDVLYDAMLARHIRPFVELSFMPNSLASGNKTVFWWKANISPPKDMSKWNDLIRALVQHWIERYGKEEVRKWYFEVWNEPDLSFFWSGTRAQYFDLYKNTAVTIKTVCPECRVGGPANALGFLEKPWLDFLAKEHVPADFLSSHVYAATAGALDVDGSGITYLDTRPETITGRVRQSREWIAHSATPNLQLHYTEWSTSYTPTDYIHDQYISAAFIVEKLRETAQLADSMSYWTFTDIFEENGPRFTPFHGGFGLMNYQGIRKPAFFAYKFLAQLGTEDLACIDKQTWVTRKPNGSIQALLWDYSPVKTPKEGNQYVYREEHPSTATSPIQLQLHGLKARRYELRVTRVGYLHNDAFTAYVRMGSPAQLTRAQVDALQTVANGAPEAERMVSPHKDGDFDLPLAMNHNDVVLVELTPRSKGTKPDKANHSNQVK